MHFELLELHRNYRNIESVNINIEKEESIVFGHFDRLYSKSSKTANETLDLLYEQYLSSENYEKDNADIQPIMLFSYDDHNIRYDDKCCIAITFMQINKHLDCNTIEAFYNYSKNVINDVIHELKGKGIINNNIIAETYIPLSFMNVAVVFYADNLTDICTIIKNILHNRIASYQYSVLSFPNKFDVNAIQQKHINISLRFIWKKDVNVQDAINSLNNSLTKIGISSYSINHLLGNNDCLLTVTSDGYKIISMLLNPNNDLSDFLSYVENTRASINFPHNDIELLNMSTSVRMCEYIFDDAKVHYSEDALIKSLNELKNSLIKVQKCDVNDILYRVVLFRKFMDVIRKHAIKGIAVPLYSSMISPYILFLEIASKKISDGDEIDATLAIIGNVINDMLSYYGNIFHCNLGFFEERGFYNNIIGLASNVELAYNEYANCICDAIISDSEKNLKVSCAVTSDKDPLIYTTEVFEAISNPQVDTDSLININIPVSYIFKYDIVSQIIIHEIAHSVGERNRELRAEIICKVISAVLSDVIYQTFILSIKPTVSPDEIKLFTDFEKSQEYNDIHKHMCEKVYDYVYTNIKQSVFHKCSNSFYMNIVTDALIDTLNALPKNNELIDALVNEIVEFQFLYYENLEDYYLAKMPVDHDILDILNQVSDYAIKSYNRHLVRKNLIDKINEIIQEQEGDKVSEIEEKSCNIYIVDLGKFIADLCSALTEAYSDIMMITLADMSFDDYIKLMDKLGKSVSRIILENQYSTWLRCNMVCKYICNKELYSIYKHEMKDEIDALPKRFDYYTDIKLFDYTEEYFSSLKTEFEQAKERCNNNPVLNSYLRMIFSEDEENHIKAIYEMYFNIKFKEEARYGK